VAGSWARAAARSVTVDVACPLSAQSDDPDNTGYDPDREAKSLLAPKRSVMAGAVAYSWMLTAAHAQDAAIDELKGKIFDARMAQQTFADGLKYCHELNGKSFYFRCATASSIWKSIFDRLKTSSKRRSTTHRSDAHGLWRMPKSATRRSRERRTRASKNARLCRAFPNLKNNSRSCKRKPLNREKGYYEDDGVWRAGYWALFRR
jgi:hypothetical protein